MATVHPLYCKKCLDEINDSDCFNCLNCLNCFGSKLNKRQVLSDKKLFSSFIEQCSNRGWCSVKCCKCKSNIPKSIICNWHGANFEDDYKGRRVTREIHESNGRRYVIYNNFFVCESCVTKCDVCNQDCKGIKLQLCTGCNRYVCGRHGDFYKFQSGTEEIDKYNLCGKCHPTFNSQNSDIVKVLIQNQSKAAVYCADQYRLEEERRQQLLYFI